jgi:hypothetical protein
LATHPNLLYREEFNLNVLNKSVLYLTGVVAFFSSCAEATRGQYEYFFCDRIHLPDALSITHDGNLRFSDSQGNRTSLKEIHG